MDAGGSSMDSGDKLIYLEKTEYLNVLNSILFPWNLI